MQNQPTRRDFVAATSLGLASMIAGSHAVGRDANPGGEASASDVKDVKHVTLLHFTDIHAQLETHPDYLPNALPNLRSMGGFARLKTAIDRHRKTAAGACFLLDGGDEFQGSGPAAWSEGEVILQPLNGLGADIFVPGNWEAVYGPYRFRELMGELTAQVACYNLHEIKSGKRLFDPAIVLERHGVHVAFVGVTDIFASKRQSPHEFEGLDTSRIDGLHKFVKQLRQEKKPDLIVAITHTGLTMSRQLAREIPDFDVILSGHTHERTPEPILEGNTIVVEPGSMGSFLGRLDLTLKAGGVERHAFQLIHIEADEFDEDAEIKTLVDASLAPHRERMDRVAVKSQTPLFRYDVLETNVDDLITDAVREIARADIGLSNGFRFGVPVLAGQVTEADVWTQLPMDAHLKTGWVTGLELKQYLEQELELVYSKDPWKLSGGWGPRASGMVIKYRALAEPGKRLLSVEVDGKPVRDDEHYTIAGCERQGEPLDVVCRHRGTHDAKVLPQMIHAALQDYFQHHPTISPMRQGRAIAVDLPPVLFSLDAILSERKT